MTHLHKLLIPDSSKNSTFILKNSPNIRYSSWYSTRYSTQRRVTWPRSNNFTIRLWLDLSHQLLVFALTTNLESGPRFADIWYKLKKETYLSFRCHAHHWRRRGPKNVKKNKKITWAARIAIVSGHTVIWQCPLDFAAEICISIWPNGNDTKIMPPKCYHFGTCLCWDGLFYLPSSRIASCFFVRSCCTIIISKYI